MSGPTLAGQLQRGLELLGEAPAAHPGATYLAYLELLDEWNHSYNLTGIKEREKMLTHHLLDSLSVLPYIRGDRCLDAGTGPGLPGLILALARPGQHWVLLDSNSKKIRFLNHLLLTLSPGNVVGTVTGTVTGSVAGNVAGNIETVQERLEQYLPTRRFSTVISRALTSALQFYRASAHLVEAGGVVLAMKGRRPDAEIEELAVAGIPHTLHGLSVPGLDAARHIIIMDSQSSG